MAAGLSCNLPLRWVISHLFGPVTFPYLPHRTVSTIHGVPLPQNSRRRHSAAQSNPPQLPDHGQGFRSNTYARLSFHAPCHTLTRSLSNSFRSNVLAGAAWQRTQHDSTWSPEWYHRPDRSEAPFPILYFETRDGPLHKAIKRDINGYFLIETGPTSWRSPYRPY